MSLSNQPEQQELELSLRGGRIIGAAMIAGVLLLAAIFAFLINSETSSGVELEILTYISLLLMVTLIPLSFYLPKLISQKLNASSSFSEILEKYRGGLIISLALSQGVGLMALVSAFVQKQFIPEYLITAFCLAMIMRHMPSKEKFDIYHRQVKTRTN